MTVNRAEGSVDDVEARFAAIVDLFLPELIAEANAVAARALRPESAGACPDAESGADGSGADGSGADGLALRPGGGLAAAVETAVRLRAVLTDRQVLAAIRASHRLVGWASAQLAHALQELCSRRLGPADHRLEQARLTGDAKQVRRAELDRQFAERLVDDEVGLELGFSHRMAQKQVENAMVLTEDLPATLEAMETQGLDPRKAETIAQGVLPLPESVRGAVEIEVLDVLDTAAGRGEVVTMPGLRDLVKQAGLRAAPGAAASRRARSSTSVRFQPAEDDMSLLRIDLPADQAATLSRDLSLGAERCRVKGDERTADQRRVDFLTESVAQAVETFRASPPVASQPGTTGPDAAGPIAAGPIAVAPGEAGPDPVGSRQAASSAVPGVARRAKRPLAPERYQVVVAVPLSVLTGDSEEPGSLSGYGPISASLAREMAWSVAESGSWRCAVVDDVHGTLLGLGRSTFSTSYRPPRVLIRHLVARDRVCSFPGCRVPAQVCDVDHAKPWAEGVTCECNTELLCGHHHRVKHESGFSMRRPQDASDPPGTSVWTTPSGREFKSAPPSQHPPGGLHARTDADPQLSVGPGPAPADTDHADIPF